MVGLYQDSFCYALNKAGESAAIIKKHKDQSYAIIREAPPGALKGEKDSTIWSEAFENQLNTLYGTLGVPLTCVIRELEIPDGTAMYFTFVEECIARAPLIGKTMKPIHANSNS